MLRLMRLGKLVRLMRMSKLMRQAREPIQRLADYLKVRRFGGIIYHFSIPREWWRGARVANIDI